MQLILASQSPRRRDLLKRAGYAFAIVRPPVSELTRPDFSPREVTLANAIRKARAVARGHPRAIVLAADTLVALGHIVIGKPRDLTHARKILRHLSGREHSVWSGVCVISPGNSPVGFSELSVVSLKKLNTRAIDRYLRRIDPLDKAGAYAAQEGAEEIIAAIAGSKTNVVGLPMNRTREALTRLGVLPRSHLPKTM